MMASMADSTLYSRRSSIGSIGHLCVCTGELLWRRRSRGSTSYPAMLSELSAHLFGDVGMECWSASEGEGGEDQ
jgi:hypothetical protein